MIFPTTSETLIPKRKSAKSCCFARRSPEKWSRNDSADVSFSGDYWQVRLQSGFRLRTWQPSVCVRLRNLQRTAKGRNQVLKSRHLKAINSNSNEVKIPKDSSRFLKKNKQTKTVTIFRGGFRFIRLCLNGIWPLSQVFPKPHLNPCCVVHACSIRNLPESKDFTWHYLFELSGRHLYFFGKVKKSVSDNEARECSDCVCPSA